MKRSALPVFFSVVLAAAGPALGSSLLVESRQDNDSSNDNNDKNGGGSDQDQYINSVCSPGVSDGSRPLPPCIAVQNIEGACAPNGTSPLALEAHAQCMCGGGLFAQWAGCLRCLRLHGARSDRDFAYYASVMTSASEMLCAATPAPAAPWQALFTSAQAGVPFPTTGATSTSDAAPSDTAVSLYYTASGPQGPGAITGSATAATATPTTADESSTTGTTGAPTTISDDGGEGSTPATEAAGSSSTPSPDSAAMPTMGVQVAWFAAAGAALAAAL
ncbi:hypothetical protein DL766_002037 [Monosporascus sp. MC13-8B]|uniref:Uncharacterized protein n=1 Tax=Monosporascus cannonballus TaxID=155416 RepID=A0ABY0HDZ0_9PEZI|nr:hypothetical protein DL762_002278 [Monosporascus cannonballus]RYO94994.1 hypothetical protein DL763_003890 [Monosporascus cannonballus]RYP36375.1 hypothetical protein DL766_002037 [Monosporascus sp. MC13-8B]